MRKIVLGCVYHISREKLDTSKPLIPRIPDNVLVRRLVEDAKTPRVCFSPFIDGCIAAIGEYLKCGKEYYVYMASGEFYIPEQDQVIDCMLSGEVWSLDPITVTYYGKIKIKERVDTCPSKHYKKKIGGDMVVEALSYNYEIIAEESDYISLVGKKKKSIWKRWRDKYEKL